MKSTFGSLQCALLGAMLLLVSACAHDVTNISTVTEDGGAVSVDDAAADTSQGTVGTEPDSSTGDDDATTILPPGDDDDDAGGDASLVVDSGPIAPAPPPTLTSISPASAIVGTAGPTIICTGTGFVARTVVQLNGAPLTTGFVSDTQIRASLPGSALAQTGTLHVSVGTAPPGGGGSAEQLFQVVNPSPTITSLAPTSALIGATGASLTVTGSSFVSGAAILFNGTGLTTTWVSATSLTASIPAAQLATSGSFPITVTNPAPGGGTSTSIAFIVSNPTVTVTSVTPSTLNVGASATSIALVGTGFVAATAVSFNGGTIASTFTDSKHMSATVPASALVNAGSFPVVVTNPAPGGGVSTPVQVAVVYPTPSLTSLSPSSAQVGAAPVTVTAIGGGYVAGKTSLLFDGVAALTTVIDASHASATLTTAQMSPAHSIQVSLANPTPGGGLSGALPFTIDDPAPVETGLSPSSALVGAGDTVVTVTGTGFVAASVVSIGTTTLATTYVDTGTLTATIPAANLTAATTLVLATTNPAPGGGRSAGLSFVVDNPGPTITSITPSSAIVPASATPITVVGTGFVSGISVVNLGGSPLPTTYANGTLGATIPAASLATAQTLSLTVVNPAPGGGTSNVSFFAANNPAPNLNSIAPTTVVAGSAATPITLTGSGFSDVSVVKINGASVAATVSSATSITVTVSATLLATPGTLSFTVTNPSPGGGTSGAQTLTVSCNTTGVDIAITTLNQTTTETLSLTSSSAPTAYRITTSQAFGNNPDTCPAQKEDTSVKEPYRAYVVMNDTAQTATLEAWAICTGNDDGYLTFYSQSTVPTTQAGLEACTGVIAEGKSGSGGFSSKSPGSASFCPGLTKANGQGLSLPACGVAVVFIQAWDKTSSGGYNPPTTLAVDLE